MRKLRSDFSELNEKVNPNLHLTRKEYDTAKGILYLLDDRITAMDTMQRVYRVITDEMAKNMAKQLIFSTAAADDDPSTAGAHCFRQFDKNVGGAITTFGAFN